MLCSLLIIFYIHVIFYCHLISNGLDFSIPLRFSRNDIFIFCFLDSIFRAYIVKNLSKFLHFRNFKTISRFYYISMIMRFQG